jgi:predicted permease
MWRDIKHAWRTLTQSRAFTAAAVISLALGIGANATIFSLINALLLRPLPVGESSQLIRIHSTLRGSGYYNLSYPEYVYYRDHNSVFSGVLAHFPTLPMTLAATHMEPETITGEIVSGNYFSVLGIRPALGRDFLPEEDLTAGAHPVVILSHSLWQKRFNSDASAVGKAIRLNGHPFTVVGIAPPGFHGAFSVPSSELWVPLMMQDQVRPGMGKLGDRSSRLLMGIGRLKRGISQQQARANLATLAGQLGQTYPDTNKNRGINLAPMNGLHPAMAPIISGFLALLMAVVALMLLIVCTNLANLLLARGTTRKREVAIRLALGASRARVVQQFLTESLLLALVGGALGLLFAFWSSHALVTLKPPLPFPVELNLSPDVRVVTFAVLASLLTGLVFGFIPALQASRTDLSSAVKEDTLPRRYGRFTLRDLLTVAQIAVSVVLLVGAGLLLRTLRNAQTIDPGLDPSQVTVVSFDPGLLGYGQTKGKLFYGALLEKVAMIRDVASVALAEFVPLSGRGDSLDVVMEGHSATSGQTGTSVGYNVVTPGYFETLHIPLVAGRTFTQQDGRDVAIVNEAFANRFSTTQERRGLDLIGKRLSVSGPGGPYLQILGVVKTGKYSWLAEELRPFLYLPFNGHYRSDITLHVQTRSSGTGNTASVLAAIRSQVRTLAPDLPLTDAHAMRESMSFALTPARLAGTILGISGLIALLLAAVGVYGVVSYATSRRTQELGIRMAVGARPNDVLRLVLREGMQRAFIGVIVGVALSFVAARALRGLLYGLGPSDPVTLVGVSSLLVCVVAAAIYFPARRAMRIDPMETLRHE